MAEQKTLSKATLRQLEAEQAQITTQGFEQYSTQWYDFLSPKLKDIFRLLDIAPEVVAMGAKEVKAWAKKIGIKIVN